MLSGIGPSAELAAHNVTPVVVQELVGSNFFVRPVYFVVWSGSETYAEQMASDYMSAEAFNEWSVNGTGPLSTTMASAHATLSLRNGGILLGYTTVLPSGECAIHHDSAACFSLLYFLYWFHLIELFVVAPLESTHLSFIYLLRPKSTHNLRLRSSNARDYPRMFYDFFSNRTDMDTIIEGVKCDIPALPFY